jgi:hypothetical protein
MWTCIYPCYINPDKKPKEGRRLPLSKLAGCNDPHVMEIAHAAAFLGFREIVIEVGGASSGASGRRDVTIGSQPNPEHRSAQAFHCRA